VLGHAWNAFERLGERVGPERAYRISMRSLNRLSDRLHDLEVRDLRARVAAVIVPGAALVAVGVAVTPFAGAYSAGAIRTEDLPLVVALVVCALAAVAVTRPRGHLALALALSAVGFALATAYSLLGAPDVALVAVLIETIFGCCSSACTRCCPATSCAARRRGSRRGAADAQRGHRGDLGPRHDPGRLVGVLASHPPRRDGRTPPRPDRRGARQGRRDGDPRDFRGLDTFVEITVVAVAMLAVAMVLRGRLRP
jgi:multicomponent Na+:H+ antiporter subunit A